MISSLKNSFPAKFKWGVSTAAYQIEGAWNEDGKSASIWDDFVRKEGKILDQSNGDVACDHYHRWKEDIDLMSTLGLTSYRFSVSWCRILPNGTGCVNQKGIDFYESIIDYCLSKNIQPMITLYHWDLPLVLEEKGGISCDDFPVWFLEYATIVISTFSNKVSHFITINQPFSIFRAYSEEKRAPGKGDIRLGLIAVSNLLYAHGLVANMKNKLYPSLKIGIVLNLVHVEPYSNTSEDIHATRMRDVLTNEIYLLPLLKGEFPHEVLGFVNDLGLDVYYYQSKNRMDIISTPIDFIGINYYQKGITTVDKTGKMPYLPVVSQGNSRSRSASGRDIFPKGLQTQLKRVYDLKKNLPIFITENGFDYRGGLNDYERINFIKQHLEVLKELCNQGYQIKGYYIWTLFDNFEWEHGFLSKYGLYALDEKKNRIPKKSAFWYKKVIDSNGSNLEMPL